MRREDLYLNDIVEAADHIATFIAGADFDAFVKSEMMRSARPPAGRRLPKTLLHTPAR